MLVMSDIAACDGEDQCCYKMMINISYVIRW